MEIINIRFDERMIMYNEGVEEKAVNAYFNITSLLVTI
jgi:hypothetical protein